MEVLMSGLVLADSATDLSHGNLLTVGVVAVIGVLGLVMAAIFRQEVLNAPEGTARMQDIAQAVEEGAQAYLKRQFRTLAVFALIAFAVLFVLPGDTSVRVGRSIFFVVGAGFSAFIGFMGMSLAVKANQRVAAAAHKGDRDSAMRAAFRTGGAVGMATVGLGLLGASIVVLLYKSNAPDVLEGFGFGAALLAMFMRVGGGIFTKAADVGADLVGKVEQNIPEDDPRNAATIADNVGDNVGDCAGMAADLFESYAVTLVAALILGKVAFGEYGLVFPLIVPAIGAVTAVIGIFLTRPRSDESGLTTINRAFYLSAAVAAVGVAIAARLYLPSSFTDMYAHGAAQVSGQTANPQRIAILAVFIGIALAVVILALTGYFTGTDHKPVKDVGKTSLTGPATVILAGISVGYESAVYTAIVIAAALWGCFLLGGVAITTSLFAVSLAGTGLLTTVGVIVAMDTFGPVSDNAQGIAEMSQEVDAQGAAILTELDAVGNTTKAITKGIAIATAVLAATALFGSLSNSISTTINNMNAQGLIGVQDLPGMSPHDLAALGINYFYPVINVGDPGNLVGLLLGAAVVFLFSGLAINAVGRAAGAVVFEVRRQFREVPGIMEGTGRPEYGRVVDICTRDSLRELATPGLLAIMAPIAVGFGLGPAPLGAFLAGAIATGVLMAIFLANSGGSWDNAKKLVEDGVHGGKGSPAHEATIIGDTVGDPFKDTAGPAINPLLKVMNLVSLLVVSTVVKMTYGHDQHTWLRILIAVVATLIAATAVYISKRRPVAISDADVEREIATA
jgi:K(+)-stimulated pyrophosphate-energized sodium pump